MGVINYWIMEINLLIYSEDLEGLTDYYTGYLCVFNLDYKEPGEVRLVFKYDEKIKLLIRESKTQQYPIELLLQIPNAENLFNFLKNQELKEFGIIQGAYKFEDQEITFLTAPPGNYFHTKDPDNNKIVFFDKYDERTNIEL